ncbi:MAG TPA: hypothetical protein GX497_09830 [Bacillus bacterium]|nr:hypothetical protein [Bacillus sp. (in: firmicutes)]
MLTSVGQGSNLNQVKAKYFEAQRSGDTAAMNKAKKEAMELRHKENEIKNDTVEISKEAYHSYHSIKE